MDVTEAGIQDETFEDHVPLWLLLTAQDSRWGGPFAPATVVEALEKQGVTGFDRVGRWKKYSRTARQVQEAVEAVERFYVDMATPGADLHEMELRLDDASPLWRYGWPLSNLPPLASIERKLKVPSINHINRTLASSDVLIGMLTAASLGQLGGAAPFKSKRQLIDRLDETARRYSLDGLKIRSLETKLKSGLDRFMEAQRPKKK